MVSHVRLLLLLLTALLLAACNPQATVGRAAAPAPPPPGQTAVARPDDARPGSGRAGITPVAESGPRDIDQPFLPRRQALPAADAPNVVLVTTDDQTLADLRYMSLTRRIVGRHGMSFPQSLSPHPLCCPARAEIVTGQFAQNNGVHSNEGPYGGFPALHRRKNTLGAWMYRAGYHTGLVGKYLNLYSAAKQGMQFGWESWSTAPNSVVDYTDFRLYTNGKTVSYDKPTDYSTDEVTRQTTHLIRRWSRGNRPFFLWASYYAPHGLCTEVPGCDTPPVPAKRHRAAFADARSPIFAKPSYLADLQDPDPMVESRPVYPAETVQHTWLERIRSLQAVDEGVAKIVSTLRAAGELNRTYVIFTSDNGYLIGEHHYEGKVVAYEESLRVPLLVRGPGIRPGSVSDRAVTTVDLAPTIVAAAHAIPGRTMDGRNLLPLLHGEGPLRGDTVLIQAGPHARLAGPAPWMYRGVRTARYTYAKWVGKRPAVELFDRTADPYQLRNLALDPRYVPVLEELQSRTEVLRNCSGPRDCFRTFGPVPAPYRLPLAQLGLFPGG
jgi:N-acetylglucosamine-6-sulfatase